MKTFTDFLTARPWLLIILGFVLLISIWVFFFTLAARNQPVRIPIGTVAIEAITVLPGSMWDD